MFDADDSVEKRGCARGDIAIVVSADAHSLGEVRGTGPDECRHKVCHASPCVRKRPRSNGPDGVEREFPFARPPSRRKLAPRIGSIATRGPGAVRGLIVCTIDSE